MYQLYRPLEIQSTLSIPVRLEFHKFINFIWRSIKVTYPTTRIILFISSCGSPEPHGLRVKLLLLRTPLPPPSLLPPAMRGMIFWEFRIQGKTAKVVSLSISGTKNSQDWLVKKLGQQTAPTTKEL